MNRLHPGILFYAQAPISEVVKSHGNPYHGNMMLLFC